MIHIRYERHGLLDFNHHGVGEGHYGVGEGSYLT